MPIAKTGRKSAWADVVSQTDLLVSLKCRGQKLKSGEVKEKKTPNGLEGWERRGCGLSILVIITC